MGSLDIPYFSDALIEPERTVYPYAWVGHLPFAYWVISLLKPKILVELGTHSGNSYSAFCQSIKSNNFNTKAYAVDTWKGEVHAGVYGEEVYTEYEAYHKERYSAFSTLLRMTFDSAVNQFEDHSIDLLHIDGLHTYEAVKHDFETWFPKLSSRAVVLFHDTHVHERNFGVHQLWKELTRLYPGFTFSHSHGLGVLLVGKEKNSILNNLCRQDKFDIIAPFFEKIGSYYTLKFSLSEKEVLIDTQKKSRVEELESWVAHQDTELNQKRFRVEELESWVAHQDTELSQKRFRVEELESWIAHQDKRLDESRSRIGELESWTAQQDKQLYERKSHVEGLESLIVHKDEQLDEIKSQVEKLGLSIAFQDKQLIEKEKQLQEKDAQILEKENQLVKTGAELAQQLADMAGRNVVLYYLNRDLAAKEAALTTLNNHFVVKSQARLVKQTMLAAKEIKLAARIVELSINDTALLIKEKALLLKTALLVLRKEKALLIKKEIALKNLAVQQAITQRGIALRIARSGFFDKKWYAQHNPDIAASRHNPILHYVKWGAAEGRDPHPLFNSKLYLKRNSDVGLIKMNPLFHYLMRGKKEGRTHYASLNQIITEEKKPKVDPILSFSTRCEIEEETVFKDDIRALAIYLPQFHAIKENNEWWGNGFTEWTNVKRGVPFYQGHYQPHVPHSDLGYYSLDDASVLEKQAEMARQHGIHGFCFYYYWFNGKRLLEKPLDRLLATGKPDFPFCFCWANENWTRTWDGGDKEILMEQTHSYENDERFIQDLIPALKDPRYIRINNKPLLIIYRPGLLPDMKGTAKHWREVCRKEGIGEIYLACMRSFGFFNPLEHGLDGAIQFPPANVPADDLASSKALKVKEGFSGHVFDAEEMRSLYSHEESSFPLMRSVCPSWDNTARRMERATSWINTTPYNYYRWLCQAIEKTRKSFKEEERLIFINAWNEWGEGCHLEPDSKYGYGWLNATASALEKIPSSRRLVKSNDNTEERHSVIYQERWKYIEDLFSSAVSYKKNNYLVNYTGFLNLVLSKGGEFECKNGMPLVSIKEETFPLTDHSSLSCLHPILYDESKTNVICFVILQYNKVNLTEQCIKAIKKSNSNRRKIHFVIVDNKSTDEVIEQTKKLFSLEKDISLIFNEENYGFARGNNIGYRFGREKIGAEFILVINNDVIIEDEGFIGSFLDLYKKYSFSILGPDIVTPDGRHESPWNDYIYDIEEWQKLKLLHEEEKGHYLKTGQAEFRKMGCSSPAQNIIINPILQGAVYILSPIFILSEEIIFNESTFLYGEEHLLAVNSLLQGHLMLYSNQLKVRHEEGASTALLPEQEKILNGYNNMIIATELCFSWLKRHLDSKEGICIPLEDTKTKSFDVLINQKTKNILIDLLFSQPGFHGGGEYGKAIFEQATHEYIKRSNCQLWVALNPNLYIDSWVWDYCKKYSINIIQVETFYEIADLVNSEKFTLFFAPAIVIYTAEYEYMKQTGGDVLFTTQKTKVIGCLFDIRDFELAHDFKKIETYRKELGCYKESSRSAKELQEEDHLQKENEENLKLMYQRILDHPSIHKIITISEYSINSIKKNIGTHRNTPIVLYPPMKKSLEEQSKEQAGVSLAYSNYALLIHAGRLEKNAASAVVAFDELCSDTKMLLVIKDLKVLLLGIHSMDELGLPELKNKERFIAGGFLSTEEFEQTLKDALFLIYPSFNEGFGYPPVEAMKHGVPSVVSNTTSIPEVCGKSAIYCDPYDISSMKEAIINMVISPISKEILQEQYKSIKIRQKNDTQKLMDLIFSEL